MDTDLAAHLALAAVAILLVSATAASVPLEDPPAEGSDASPPAGPGDESGGGGYGLPGVPRVPPLVVGLLAVGLAAAGYWLRRRPGTDDSEDDPPEADPPDLDPPTDPEATDPSRSVTVVPPENEVYRAWNGMARRVVDPGNRSLSPSEIARRARERGLNDDAVDELTNTFLAVRYGPLEATPDVERRARDATDRLGDPEGPSP